MAAGGYRAGAGRPVDPNALRRDRKDDQAGWTNLPERREADAPTWPLVDPTDRELKVWEDHWSLPQAHEWERQNLEYEVALFIRSFCEAEQPGAAANLRTLVKQQQEVLGLSLAGLHRMRWRVGGEIPTEAPVAKKPAKRKSARERRLELVKDAETA